MAVTSNLGLNLLDQNQSQPHVPLNDDMQILENAVTGKFSKDLTGVGATYTLTADGARYRHINFWASGAAQACTVTVPNTVRMWLVDNWSGYDVLLKTAAGSGVTIPTGYASLIWCDGGNVHAQCSFHAETIRIGDAANIILGTTTGTKIGTSTSQKLGLWNATPIIQPASANQAAVTGSAGATYTSAEQTLINSLKTLVNQLRADLVAVGAIKGAA